jgi:hypothetical protein
MSEEQASNLDKNTGNKQIDSASASQNPDGDSAAGQSQGVPTTKTGKNKPPKWHSKDSMKAENRDSYCLTAKKNINEPE